MSYRVAILFTVFAAACGGHPGATGSVDQDNTDAAQGAERWNADRERPQDIVPDASVKLADVIGKGDVGKTFGVDDNHVPYPDTYWPFTEKGIDSNWNNDTPPLEKYMAMVDPSNNQKAIDWELNNHGPNVPGVADWWGHCPGWTGASMSNAPIQHAVDAKLGADGSVSSCSSGDTGCVHFEIGDLNALMAEVYVDADSSFLGARCDTAPTAIKRDQYGRVIGPGAGCKGINAGSLMVVLADRMKNKKQAMAIDAQNSSNTDQIWNQPAYRYKVYRYRALFTKDAAALVSNNTSTTYQWDPDAHGFVFVDIGIQWVSERGPNLSVVSGLSSTREMRVTAVLELDNTVASGVANIIGGEYVDDPSVGTNRLTVAPFVWVSKDTGYDNLDPGVDGDNHNPYLKFSTVKQLVKLGNNGL